MGKSQSLVVVTKDSELKPAQAMLNNGDFLLLSTSNNSWKPDFDLVTIIEQQFGHEKISLLRKTTLPKKYTSQVLHLDRNTSTWLEQIKMAESSYRLYVVVELDLHGVQAIFPFIRQRSTVPGLEHVRYVLILDEDAPKFSLNERLYYEQLSHDLLVNIFYNGQWGSFCHVPIDIPSLTMSGTCESRLLSLGSAEGVKIVYLGLNPQDLSIMDSECRSSELGTLDFSGYSESGQRLMGIVRWNDKMAPESHLTWKVPESWSLEEAATVPLAYATAYYSLVLKARIDRGERVLVQAGWSSIGQAAIALALDYDCPVYTTVANQEQRSFLKQCFPQLPDNHIFSCKDSTFDTHILIATNGEGINIAINCLCGSKLQSSIRCLAPYARLIQLGQNDVISNQSIGMDIFLKSMTVTGVSPEHLFDLSSEWKEALHSGIQSSLQTGVIHPMKYTVFPRQQTQVALRTLTEINQTQKVVLNVTPGNTNGVSQPLLKSSIQNFYLVVGEKLGECLDVAEWLASHGVCQVVITVRNKMIPNYVKHRMQVLQSSWGMKIILLFSSVLSTLKDAEKLVEQASSVCEGPMAGIFILPVEPVDQENSLTVSVVCNLDLATRKLKTVKHFVCLLMEEAWSTCESRHNAGLPALAVLWRHHGNENSNLLWSLNVLDTLLTTELQDPVIVLSEAQQEADKANNAVPTLDVFLPSSVKTLASFGEDLLLDTSASYWIEELTSLSPGHGKVKEVPPVFLVPGLQGPACKILQSLAMKLMYPIFCVRFADFSTIAEAAASLVKYIQQQQSSGPYNLVGISWGGALTIEIARLLEAQGHSTRIILIDGAPETTQAAIHCLENEDKFDMNLVSRLLHIPECKVTNSWSELLTDALKDIPVNMQSQLATALTTLRSCLSALLQYKPLEVLLKGEIELVRPSSGSEEDNCGLDQFFWHLVKIHRVEGDHLTILQSSETARIINDFIL